MNNAQQNVAAITAGIVGKREVTILYTDQDNVTSIRWVMPDAIERCANGQTVVRCFDLARKGPRKFRLARILMARTGLHEPRVTF